MQRWIGALLLVLCMGGCGGARMVAPQHDAPSPSPQEAMIVFMRPNVVVPGAPGARIQSGDALDISASVWDVTESTNKLVSVLGVGDKVGYRVAPGQYTFMVVGEGAWFMRATVAAGRTYHAVVFASPGKKLRTHFTLQPMRAANYAREDFARWDSTTRFVTSSALTDTWEKRNAKSVAARRARYWPEWIGQTPAQLTAQTLNASDGR